MLGLCENFDNNNQKAEISYVSGLPLQKIQVTENKPDNKSDEGKVPENTQNEEGFSDFLIGNLWGIVVGCIGFFILRYLFTKITFENSEFLVGFITCAIQQATKDIYISIKNM